MERSQQGRRASLQTHVLLSAFPFLAIEPIGAIDAPAACGKIQSDEQNNDGEKHKHGSLLTVWVGSSLY